MTPVFSSRGTVRLVDGNREACDAPDRVPEEHCRLPPQHLPKLKVWLDQLRRAKLRNPIKTVWGTQAINVPGLARALSVLPPTSARV